MRHEFEIAVIGELELNFVPYVGKQRPGIVEDRRVKHGGVRKLDDASARMIGPKVLAAEFPQRRIEIADVNDIAMEDDNGGISAATR